MATRSTEEVRQKIENEISIGNLHITDTEGFLTKLFPVDDSVIDEVYQKLISGGVYDIDTKEWRGLPKTVEEDGSYHRLFVEIAESIRTVNTSPEKVSLHCKWINRRSNPSKSHDLNTPIVRPNMVCVLEMEKEDQEKWEALTKFEEENKEVTGQEEGEGKMGEADVGKVKMEKEEQNALDAWWLRINVPIEIKPAESESMLKHIEQLLGYMWQVLQRQINRLFVPGLLLSCTGLHVWICDRSGALGTQTAIDIHEDPKSLIRVILGCSLLPPVRLGWDPTMRLCRQPINPQCPELVHPYDPSVRFSDYRDFNSDPNWVIEMPSGDDSAKREEYITVRVLIGLTADCKSGRATVVWAVIKLDDMKTKNPPHHIYVMKQCWRETARPNEGDYFPAESETRDIHLGRIHSYEDVEHGEHVVDTHTFIRQGLDQLPPRIVDTNVNGERTDEVLQTGRPVYQRLYKIDVHQCTQPIGRTFTRLLMKDYGWPLKEFRDLLELTRVSEQLLITHKVLYFTGTLHRDISSENVIICPTIIEGVMSTECRLVDLCNANYTEDFVLSALGRVKHKDDASSKEPKLLESVRTLFQHFFDAKVTDDVANAWSDIHSMSSLGEAVLDYDPSIRNSMITGYSIGLLEESQNLPKFTEQASEKCRRDATLPYASAEILSGLRMFRDRSREIDVHGAVHDLEAFFWAIADICITRGGPGGKRREEIKAGTLVTQETRELFHFSRCFFYTESTTLISNKSQLFTRNDFVEYVLPHVHPYFEPLKPLLVKWWKILRIAYRFPTFETIHDWFLDALRETILVLKQLPPEAHPVSADVDAFRQRDLRSLQYFPSQDDTGQKSQDARWRPSFGGDILPDNSHHYPGNVEKPLFQNLSHPRNPSPPPPDTPIRPIKRQKIFL